MLRWVSVCVCVCAGGGGVCGCVYLLPPTWCYCHPPPGGGAAAAVGLPGTILHLLLLPPTTCCYCHPPPAATAAAVGLPGAILPLAHLFQGGLTTSCQQLLTLMGGAGCTEGEATSGRGPTTAAAAAAALPSSPAAPVSMTCPTSPLNTMPLQTHAAPPPSPAAPLATTSLQAHAWGTESGSFTQSLPLSASSPATSLLGDHGEPGSHDTLDQQQLCRPLASKAAAASRDMPVQAADSVTPPPPAAAPSSTYRAAHHTLQVVKSAAIASLPPQVLAVLEGLSIHSGFFSLDLAAHIVEEPTEFSFHMVGEAEVLIERFLRLGLLQVELNRHRCCGGFNWLKFCAIRVFRF